jgi:hypothetical protein
MAPWSPLTDPDSLSATDAYRLDVVMSGSAELTNSLRKPRSRVLRGTYLVLGILCTGLAYLGLILPGLPAFDFVLVAAFFFARSSDRFHDWLVNHKVFGRMIRGYQGGLTMRMKIAAAAAITISVGFSTVVLLEGRFLRTILGVVWLYAMWFVFSRPTRSTVPERLH